jgi:cytochrome c biogenesis protein
MATSETEVTTPAKATPMAEATAKATQKKADSVLDKALALLSSVRFGIVMLSLLLTCCMIGMLIMQVNVEGFDKYYQALTPAKRDVYQFLGFFDIYHSWYFSLLLAITGLNIILASIDRFPAAWQYVVKPKQKASPKFIAAQMFTAESETRETPQELAERTHAAWRKHGFRGRISEEENRITVFAQKNVWNRLGAYVVHVALLTIFIGGFLTNKYGVGGTMQIVPGMQPSNEFLVTEFGPDGKPRQSKAFMPFQIECRDLQQKLVRPSGGLDANNTIDWLSSITVVDSGVRKDLLVHLNNVGDYSGYRFFQSMFDPFGYAREIELRFRPKDGGPERTVRIPRDGKAIVEGIGQVEFVKFYCHFDLTPNGPQNLSPEYENPAAELAIIGTDGKPRRAFAFFNPEYRKEFFNAVAEKMGQQDAENAFLISGNEVLLDNFEKVSTAHTLTIQYDPGRIPVYIGFLLLSVALCGVFFFAHQRVWAVIEPHGKGSKIYFGGNTNRNRPAFEGRFNSLVKSVNGGGEKDE